MENVNLPAPVALAGAVLCALGGFLVGVVAGPEPTGRTTATVDSFRESDSRLCLRGEAVVDVPGAEDGVLCGFWRDSAGGSGEPKPGDEFAFVALRSESDEGEVATFLYGDVVP